MMNYGNAPPFAMVGDYSHTHKKRSSREGLVRRHGSHLGDRHSYTGSAIASMGSFTEEPVVPEAVLKLEPLTLQLSFTKQRADVRYVLTVRHDEHQTKWRQSRSFDEYRRLQQRLLKTLDPGHFCNAGCPVMYTFIRSYFPKKNLFTLPTERVIQARKEALDKFFQTLMSFVLNRANHKCSVAMDAFAPELVDFVYGDYANRCTDSAPLEDTVASQMSEEEPEEEPEELCTLCQSSLCGEAFGNSSFSSVSDGTVATSASSSSSIQDDKSYRRSSSMPPKLRKLQSHYVTTLDCGHCFHDECIVPVLNDTLRCPTCGHLEVQ